MTSGAKNGSAVAAFEQVFAQYVGARYCVALCNGTATLHTALVALGVKPGDRVAVPPLTMSATTIAVLHAGAVPVFCDVEPDTWLMTSPHRFWGRPPVSMPVSLYGLHWPHGFGDVDDAAETLRAHDSRRQFTSYSFQASKIVPLGEGGMLATNDEALATRAREFSSLGYRMRPDQPRIDPAILKSPDYARHHTYPAWNYRMSDLVAERGLRHFDASGGNRAWPLTLVAARLTCALIYRDAIAGCSWITPQHVPDGWTHDYWAYAVALESAELWHPFVAAIVRHGGERPYAAWLPAYREPAFRYLAEDGCCPVAESLQPRLVQFQTNNVESAKRNAQAVAGAVRELNGGRC